MENMLVEMCLGFIYALRYGEKEFVIGVFWIIFIFKKNYNNNNFGRLTHGEDVLGAYLI